MSFIVVELGRPLGYLIFSLMALIGVPLGVPIIRIIVYWGLYWGPLILGNYHIYVYIYIYTYIFPNGFNKGPYILIFFKGF